MQDFSQFTIFPEMVTLIGSIDEFKGMWRESGRLSQQQLDKLKQAAIVENIAASSRLEGLTLTDQDVEKFLAPSDFYSLVSHDEQEVAGYAYVFEEIFQNHSTIDISENTIKQLHGWLLQFSREDQWHRGHYKKGACSLEAFHTPERLFETAAPVDVPQKMHALLFWMNSHFQQKTLHPLLVIGIFIAVFLSIHPFQSGNRKLARVLTTLLLLKAGYPYAPYSSLDYMFEKRKEEYQTALRKAQEALADGSVHLESWIVFFLRSLQKQKEMLERKMKQDTSSLLHMPALRAHIVTLMESHGRLGIGEFEEMTGANRNTLKKHLSQMVQDGRLLRLGRGKATWYVLS